MFPILGLALLLLQLLLAEAVVPQIKNINVKCDENGMRVNVEFDIDFNGIIFSKGHYSDPNCRYVQPSSGRAIYQFVIPQNGCGSVRRESVANQQLLSIENTVIVQNDPDFQEVWDSAKKLKCDYEHSIDKVVTSAPYSVDFLEIQEVTFPGDKIDCWMEIHRGPSPFAPSVSGVVPIGEKITVTVYIRDQDSSYDIHVKDCFAYDSPNYDNPNTRSIRLTDERGCTVKEKVLKSFYRTRDTKNTGATIIAYGIIDAFKFPEKMDVFVVCNVEVCKGSCNNPCQPFVGSAGGGGVGGNEGETKKPVQQKVLGQEEKGQVTEQIQSTGLPRRPIITPPPRPLPRQQFVPANSRRITITGERRTEEIMEREELRVDRLEFRTTSSPSSIQGQLGVQDRQEKETSTEDSGAKSQGRPNENDVVQQKTEDLNARDERNGQVKESIDVQLQEQEQEKSTPNKPTTQEEQVLSAEKPNEQQKVEEGEEKSLSKPNVQQTQEEEILQEKESPEPIKQIREQKIEQTDDKGFSSQSVQQHEFEAPEAAQKGIPTVIKDQESQISQEQQQSSQVQSRENSPSDVKGQAQQISQTQTEDKSSVDSAGGAPSAAQAPEASVDAQITVEGHARESQILEQVPQNSESSGKSSQDTVVVQSGVKSGNPTSVAQEPLSKGSVEEKASGGLIEQKKEDYSQIKLDEPIDLQKPEQLQVHHQEEEKEEETASKEGKPQRENSKVAQIKEGKEIHDHDHHQHHEVQSEEKPPEQLRVAVEQEKVEKRGQEPDPKTPIETKKVSVPDTDIKTGKTNDASQLQEKEPQGKLCPESDGGFEQQKESQVGINQKETSKSQTIGESPVIYFDHKVNIDDQLRSTGDHFEQVKEGEEQEKEIKSPEANQSTGKEAFDEEQREAKSRTSTKSEDRQERESSQVGSQVEDKQTIDSLRKDINNGQRDDRGLEGHTLPHPPHTLGVYGQNGYIRLRQSPRRRFNRVSSKKRSRLSFGDSVRSRLLGASERINAKRVQMAEWRPNSKQGKHFHRESRHLSRREDGKDVEYEEDGLEADEDGDDESLPLGSYVVPLRVKAPRAARESPKWDPVVFIDVEDAEKLAETSVDHTIHFDIPRISSASSRSSSSSISSRSGRRKRSIIVVGRNATLPMAHSFAVLSPIEDLSESDLERWEAIRKSDQYCFSIFSLAYSAMFFGFFFVSLLVIPSFFVKFLSKRSPPFKVTA